MKATGITIIVISFILSLLSCNKTVNHIVPDASTKDFASGVKGEVFVGPISHTKKAGALNKVPYEAVVKFINFDKDVIMQIQTDAKGKFEVELNPGVYKIIPEALTSTNGYPAGKIENVVIKQNEIVYVEINFDSGIR